MDLIGAFLVAIAVALVGGLVLDRIRGGPKRAEGRMARLLQSLPDEAERLRWEEELRGVLLEHEGRPIKQFRESSEVITAAQAIVDLYAAERDRPLRFDPEAKVSGPPVAGNSLARAANSMTREALKEALELLSYRERRILELLYGLGGERVRSHDEVGRTFNVTATRIQEIERLSLMKLHSLGEAQKLREIR